MCHQQYRSRSSNRQIRIECSCLVPHGARPRVAGERSNTRASSNARRVPGAPAGCISSVVRCTDSRGQIERGRRSTTWSASGSPCVSAASMKDARAHVANHANMRGPTGARKTRSKEVRRGLVQTRRAPHMRRDSSPGEGTICRASVCSVQRFPSNIHTIRRRGESYVLAHYGE
jgi:hypothetical protein